MPIKDTAHAVTVVPQDVLVNQRVEQVNDALRFLPSVAIRDQQGFDISRPHVNDARYYISVAAGNIVGSPGANNAYLGAPRTYHASLELDF